LLVLRDGDLVDDLESGDGDELRVVDCDALGERMFRGFVVETRLGDLLRDGMVGDANCGIETARRLEQAYGCSKQDLP
jgi:hypothetical protein